MTLIEKLKRTGRILAGYARCHWYMLRHGMWRGECEMTGYDQQNRLMFIMTVKGRLFDGTVEPTRVFYTDESKIRYP